MHAFATTQRTGRGAFQRAAARAPSAAAYRADEARAGVPRWLRGQVEARLPVQAKLEVSAPGDRFEQEADQAAAAVMSGRGAAVDAAPRAVAPMLYRMEARPEDLVDSASPSEGGLAPAEDEADPATVQRSAEPGTPDAGPGFERSLQQSGGGRGHTLPAYVRGFMERGFDRDFSGVRIHSDANADRLARQIHARAFTHGSDIYFARSQYQPASQQGRHLLAHELAHVVQQSDGRVARQVQRATRCNAYPGYNAGANLMTYNCGGLATRTYQFIAPASAVHQTVQNEFVAPYCPQGDCGPGDVRFWQWEYDMHFEDDLGNRLTPDHRDFHVVAGRADSSGADPTDVYTKNGRRQVHGPGSGPSFQPAARDRTLSNDPSETPVTHNGRPMFSVRSNMSEYITCAGCHP